MPGTHSRQYLVSQGQNVFYPPKFDKTVIKLHAELMHTVQPLVCGTRKTPKQSKREREPDIVLILPELRRRPLCTFRLCLHVGINARRASVTDFLLGHLVSSNVGQPLTPLPQPVAWPHPFFIYHRIPEGRGIDPFPDAISILACQSLVQ